MKSLRSTVQFCLTVFALSLLARGAWASTLTLSGNMLFSSLDGSAQDSDGLANGVFTVNGDLVIDGTINCNDDLPLPSGAGACPIRISTSGDLTIEAGGGIFAENRRGGGNGGDVQLDVGGALTLHGPDGSLSGAIVSTSRTPGTVGTAGSLTATVTGSVDLQEGSVLSASSLGGTAGPISVTGETVTVAGLVASGPSRTILASLLTGRVLDDGNSGQTGGTIHLRALGSTVPGLRIEPEGIVVSQGEGGGSRLVLLEACGIEVNGLVASVSKNNGPSQVALRSGKGILIDGRDLGNSAPAEGRFGRVRADSTQQGAAGYLVDLFAQLDIQVLGPDPSATALFAVSSIPGDQPLRFAGGTITAISLAGALDATGNAFETGNTVNGDKGGDVDLQAQGDVTLDGATLRAVGDYTSTSNARAGGHITVRSFQGAVSWTFGIGDVRPTGTGIPAARRGTIEITACSTVDTTGSQFPVNGSVVAPFPVENEGVCSPTSPSLPSGEPPLPVCAPPNSPPVPSGGPFSVAENSANGTSVGTVAANDPDAGQTHTFSILSGNTDGAFTINSTTGEITVANSAALDFETNPTFSLTVEATDDGTPPLSGTGTVVVNLTDENEQPTDINLSNASVSENQPSGTLVGVFSTVDPDTTDSFTYTLAAGAGDTDNSSFQITGDQLKTAAIFNYEVKNSYSIRVRSTDSGGLFTEKIFTITVLDAPEAPLAVDDAYDTIGNTRLEVRNEPSVGGPKVVVTGDVMDNDSDPDSGATLTVTPASGTTTKGGSFSILADGTFTYEPEAGDVHGTGTEDTFTYTLTDGTFEVTGTVWIRTVARIWYVKNDAPAPGTGRSHEPFNTLAAAQSASGADDYIFVYLGDGTSTGQDGGITLQSGQHLIGEHGGLTIPITSGTFNGTPAPTTVDLVTAVPGNRPLIDNAGGNAVSVTDAIPVEIVGLSLSGSLNAVDWTTTGIFSNSGTLDISDNEIRSAGAEGIDVNAGGTGTLTLNLTGNNFTGTAANNGIDLRTAAGVLRVDLSNNTNVQSNTNGILVDGSGGGTLTITGFANNSVHQGTVGTGISVTSATFDSDPSTGGSQQVGGGSTLVGVSGDGVGGAGMVLTTVQGNLFFTDLDVIASGGAGLRVSGTGSGMTFGMSPSVGIIEATGGPAVDVTSVALMLPLSNLKSTNSATTGVALNSITGSFSAGPGSSISNIMSTAGTAFQVGSSNATISYAGTINTTTGKGVDLTSNTGSTIDFTGTLTLSSGANTAFNATGGGTVTTTDTASTLTTTTGTALNVVNTTISASGLKFRSISANGATSGIVLNNTGSSGGLTVTGDGGGSNNGSGGTIQNTGGASISLTDTANVSLGYLNITNSGTDGISINNINGFTLNRSTISDSAGTAPADKGIDVGNFTTGTAVNGAITITNTIVGPVTGSSPHDSLAVGIGSGTSIWNVTNNTFRNTGNSGVNLQLRGSAVVNTFDIDTCTFAGAGSVTSARGVFANTLDDAVMTLLTIENSTFTNNNIHIDLNQQNDTDPVGSHTFAILNNGTMTGANSHAINIFSAAGSFGGAFTGTIDGNTVGNAGVTGSGSAVGNGIRVNINGGSDATIKLNGNTVRQTPNGRGIEIIGRNGTGGLDVTVTNNDINPQDTSGFPLAAILVQSNCLTTCNTVRSDVRGNTVPSGTDVADLLNTYLALIESSSSTLELMDTTAPISGTCASELAATNNGSTGVLGGCALIAGPISTP